MRKSIPLILSLLFFVSLISVVQAPQDIDIMDVPEAVGESFGIPEANRAFVGGIFMSMILFLALVLPTLLLRNKAPTFFMSFLVLSFCVAVNWLPIWMMVVVILLIASMFASKMKRVFT